MATGPVLDKAGREEGAEFAPKFDADGLLLAIAVDARDGAVLMAAYMNAQALDLTLATGVAHYWSRSRNSLWRKGDTSGQVQHVIEMRVDCDQDAVLMEVRVGGDGNSCHTGRKSCFYRRVVAADGTVTLAQISEPTAG